MSYISEEIIDYDWVMQEHNLIVSQIFVPYWKEIFRN